MDKQVIISVKTILFTLLLLLLCYVCYRLAPVFGLLLISLLIVISVESLVKFFMSKTLLNRPVGRSVAVLVSYLLLILFISFVLTVGIPPVVVQIRKLLSVLFSFAAQFNITSALEKPLTEILSQFKNISGGVLSFTFSIFSNMASVISVVIFSVYMSLDWENIQERFVSLFPPKKQDEVTDTLLDVETNIGNWVKGQLFLMFVIGTFSFVGFLTLGIDYPLALGLVAGILEFVPMLGPIITAVLAGIIGFSMSPIKGFGVIVLCLIIQQLENNLLVPKVMQKVSGFSPLVILLALLVGSEFFGISGAVLAVPVTMIVSILVKRFLLKKYH